MKKKKNDTVFIKKQKRRLRRKNKDGNKDIDKSGGVVFLMSFWIRRMVRRNFLNHRLGQFLLGEKRGMR